MENAANQGAGAGGEVKTNEEQVNEKNDRWSKSMVVLGYVTTVVITAVNGIMIAFGYRAVKDGGWGWPPAILVPAVGIVTLLGVLAISNFFQGNKDLRNGQIRAAIAASKLAVYFFVLALVMFTDASDKLSPEKTVQAPAAQANGGDATGDANETASSTEAAAPQKTGVANVMESFTDLVKVVLLGYFAVRGVTEVTDTISSTVEKVKGQQGTPATPQDGTTTQSPDETQNNTPPPKPDRSQFVSV